MVARDAGRMTFGNRRLGIVTALLSTVAIVVRPQLAVGFALVAAVFVPLERLRPLRRQPTLRPGWRTDVAHFFVNNLLSLAGTVVVAGVLVGVLSLAVDLEGIRTAVGLQPGPVQFAEAVLIIALAGYWAHRLAHRVPALWRFHAVHHSSEALDWLASARLHPVDLVVLDVVVGVPLFVLGFSRETLGLSVIWTVVTPFLNHSNVRLRLPVLRWILPNPEWHHWHHAADAEALDRNFSPFPVVDVLFGTAHLPTNRWPSGYGIREPMPDGYLRQLAHPFRRGLEPATVGSAQDRA